jgi:hypothetical protein
LIEIDLRGVEYSPEDLEMLENLEMVWGDV